MLHLFTTDVMFHQVKLLLFCNVQRTDSTFVDQIRDTQETAGNIALCDFRIVSDAKHHIKCSFKAPLVSQTKVVLWSRKVR